MSKNTYQPVFHFIDASLYRIFLDRIPHPALIDLIKADGSLQKRAFRGFRISDATPQSHISSVFRREVLQNKNGAIATKLCRRWLHHTPDLLNDALNALGIQVKDPHDETWLKLAQEILASKTSAVHLRSLAVALSPKYPASDILIFISLIGHGQDQTNLRDSIERELKLSTRTFDTGRTYQSVIQELAEAEDRVRVLEAAKVQLSTEQQAEMQSATDALDATVTAHSDLTADVTRVRGEYDRLSSELEELAQRRTARRQELTNQESILAALTKRTSRERQAVGDLAAGHRAALAKADAELVSARKHAIGLTDEVAALKPQSREETLPEQPRATMPGGALDNNSICYQAIQRTFRNSIVDLLRTRLTAAFPADHIQRVKMLFKAEWQKMESNAAESRVAGGTRTIVRDEYDLLGTNNFFAIFSQFYSVLIVSAEQVGSIAVPPVKTKLLGNIKKIQDFRNPLSHPVEEEVSHEEAYHVLLDAKQVLTWLGLDGPAQEMSLLAGKLDGGAIDEPPLVVRRLPIEDSIYQEFVGRDNVLADLKGCFESPDSRRCVLAGDGGKGKSAIAFRFAQELAGSTSRFQLIVWLSAKRRNFQSGVTTIIESPDFATLDEAVDRLLNEYGVPAHDLARPIADRKKILLEYLEALPAFIIADDIDTVLDDYEVVGLFTHEIPQTKSAVLLTSRRDIAGVKSLIVKGFDGNETTQFVRSRTKLYGLDSSLFSQSTVAEIARVTDGSPLYMDDLLRLTKILNVKDAVRIWQDKKGDEARRYALQRELEKLTNDAKVILIAAAISDDPISFAELEDVLRLSDERLYSALSELQTLFLFPKHRLVEGEQRFQINLNTKKLVRLVEGSSDLYARIERAIKALGGRLPDVGQGIVSSLIRQAYLRLNSGKPSEAEAILQDAILKYPQSTDLRGFLGFVYKRQERVADARTQFEAASRLKNAKEEMYMQWIKMELAYKEWSKAVAVCDKALKIHPKAYEILERKTFAKRQAGFDLYRGIHREKAEKMWAEAAEDVRRSIKPPEVLENGARRLNASMFRTIVICLDMLGKLDERDQWLERWEQEHPDDENVATQKQILADKDANRFKRSGMMFFAGRGTG